MLNHPLIKKYIAANNFGQELGMVFTIDNDGHVNHSLNIKEKHLATPIAAHGGVVCAMMDATMGVCALLEAVNEDMVVSTLEMKISFVSPAKMNDQLFGTSRLVKKGKRLLFLEGEIKNSSGKLVAMATGTFNVYPWEKAGF